MLTGRLTLSSWRGGGRGILRWICPCCGWRRCMDPFTGVEHDGVSVGPVFDPSGRPWVITTQTCDLGGRHPETGIHSSMSHRLCMRVSSTRTAYGSRSTVRPGTWFQVLSPFSDRVAGVGDGPKKPEWFADLRLQLPVSKAALLSRDPIEGFATEDEYLELRATGLQAIATGVGCCLERGCPATSKPVCKGQRGEETVLREGRAGSGSRHASTPGADRSDVLRPDERGRTLPLRSARYGTSSRRRCRSR